MGLKGNHIGWLHIIVHHLPCYVLVELASSSSQSILLVLVVIGIQMGDKSWSHMSMVFARSHTWVKHGSNPSIYLCPEAPDWSNHEAEIDEDKCPTMLRTLNVRRVQVHVVLRSKVVIDVSVNVLEVNESCMLVLWVQLRIWLVEVAPTPDCCHLREV